MTLLSRLLLLTASVTASSVFAADPSLTFEINSDQKSFVFKTENQTGEELHCTLIEISAAIGKKDCGDTLAAYHYKLRNKTYKQGTRIENTTFGIDFLAQKSRELNEKELVYCGPVETKLDCK